MKIPRPCTKKQNGPACCAIQQTQQSPESVVGVHPLQVGDKLRQRQGVAGLKELDAVLQTAVPLHRVEVEVVGVSSHLREA